MKSRFLFLFSLTFLTPPFAPCADWPQWRGPGRNGIVPASPALAPLDGNEPELTWEFPGIPSDHDGGHGSVAVVQGKVIIALVWHRDVPTEERRFTGEVLSDLGYRSVSQMEPQLVEKMENTRLNLSRSLRGAALDDFAKKWVEEHVTDEKVRLSLGGWIESRFKKGKAALPLTLFAELQDKSQHVFANQTELEAWVASRDWTDAQKSEVLSKVPATKKEANDVILALDAQTGATLWKFEEPGFPSGRASSSTPTAEGGKIFAALSNYLYCVDEASGSLIWKAPLEHRKGPACSPLVALGKVFLNQNRLTAFDAQSGTKLWENTDVKASHSSPSLWKNLVIINSSQSVVGVDAESGATRWTIAGGGDSTPVVSGDHLVFVSPSTGANLCCYRLAPDQEPQKLWSKEYSALRYSSSPIVYGGHVYHLGSARHWCLDLETGEVAWERPVQSSISSPILADGKLMVYENNGGLLSMIEASPEDYRPLGKIKVAALYCASPAIAGRDLFIRTKDSLKCLRLK